MRMCINTSDGYLLYTKGKVFIGQGSDRFVDESRSHWRSNFWSKLYVL